jgi:hypothetical protein
MLVEIELDQENWEFSKMVAVAVTDCFVSGFGNGK